MNREVHRTFLRRTIAAHPAHTEDSVQGSVSCCCYFSGVARPQFLGEHIDINKLLLINIYFNRDLYYVVALYTNGHDRIGRFCSYQLNRASSLWTFLYVVTIINEHAHNFWGNIFPPMFPRSYASGYLRAITSLGLLLCTLGNRYGHIMQIRNLR